MESLEFEDGKYTVCREDGNFYALRHGEAWRDLTGDKLVSSMFSDILELRGVLKEFLEDKLETIKSEKRGTISFEDRMIAEARSALKTAA